MKKQSKAFLRNAVLMTLIDAVIIIFMNEWGVAQILIVVLVSLLAAGQWLLWVYIRKTK